MPREYTGASTGGGAPTGAAGGDLAGTYPNPSVAQVQGVAVTAAQATLLSQLNNATARNTSTLPATAAAGEETVLTGSTAAGTLTLPVTPQASTINTILNLSSVSVTLAPGAGATLNVYGTTGNLTMLANSSYQCVYIGTTWYAIDSNNLANTTGALPESAVTNLVSDLALKAPLASPTLTGVPLAPTAAAGTNTTQIASTAYVTTGIANAIAGVNPAVAVQAATTAAANTSGFTYANGAAGIGATLTNTSNANYTVDGYTFTAVGQRLLVKNDTQSPSGAFNGIYSVTTLNVVGVSPIILTRVLDYDQSTDINNTGAIPVVNGTVNALTSWICTSTVNTVGTDPLTFSQFSFSPSLAVSGDLAGTLPNPTLAVIGSATGPSGSATVVPVVTIDTKGRVTALTTATIAIPQSAVTSLVASGKTLTVNNILTLAGTDSTTMTFPSTSDTVVTLGATQTLTNKTLTTAALGSSTATTQAFGDNSTKVATTAYADVPQNSLSDLYTAGTNAIYETIPHRLVRDTLAAPASGTLVLIPVALPTNVSIGHIGFVSGSTAASVPTHWWYGLYDNNRNQLAVTADQTSGAWAANTLKTLAIATIASGASSTFTTTYTGMHYVGFLMAATTVVTLFGFNSTSAFTNAIGPNAGTSDTAQTTPPAFAHQAGAITNSIQGGAYAIVYG